MTATPNRTADRHVPPGRRLRRSDETACGKRRRQRSSGQSVDLVYGNQTITDDGLTEIDYVDRRYDVNGVGTGLASPPPAPPDRWWTPRVNDNPTSASADGRIIAVNASDLDAGPAVTSACRSQRPRWRGHTDTRRPTLRTSRRCPITRPSNAHDSLRERRPDVGGSGVHLGSDQCPVRVSPPVLRIGARPSVRISRSDGPTDRRHQTCLRGRRPVDAMTSPITARLSIVTPLRT
jgi:hypothetical protein